MNRREFLKLGLGASAFVAGCKCPFCNCGKKPIALQLWSINKIMWKEDPAKTFDNIAALGYDGVEFAGFNKKSAKEIGKLLKDAGLRGMGAHISGDSEYTGDGLKRNLDFLTEAGIESMTSAWADYDTADGWKKFGELMGKAADIAVDWDIPISVHNHCHEFTKVYDGVYAWDLIFKDSSPRLQQQLDTSQVVHPGLDVVERLKKYPGRSYSIHMKENVPKKDGLPNDDGFFGVPPPDGGKLVDFKGTVAYLANEPGFSWYVVECERRPDTLEPAKRNLQFMRNLI